MKKILLFFLFILFSSSVFSQEKPEEEKKTYVENGKIYWNKSLPITISLSSPNNPSIKLDKPFYLDTEGVNYIRTKWEMDSTGKYITPLREQSWEIYADSEPPKTSIEFIASSSYIYNGKKYYSDDLKVQLKAKDELSGVAKIYYSINGSDFFLNKDFIKFEAGIDINIKFYAVDNVGNVEEISQLAYDYDHNIFNFSVDDKAPKTFLVNNDTLLSPKHVIKLNSVDSNGVGVHSTYYAIDTFEFKKYENQISLTQLKDGEHKIRYYSLDLINNKEGVNEFNFYVDAIAPEINIEEKIIKEELTNLRHITLLVQDNKSDVEKVMVQLKDGSEYIQYTKPFYIDISHEKIKVKAIDGVGNETIHVIQYKDK